VQEVCWHSQSTQSIVGERATEYVVGARSCHSSMFHPRPDSMVLFSLSFLLSLTLTILLSLAASPPLYYLYESSNISARKSHAAMRCLYYTLLASLAFIYSATAQTATTSISPSTQTVIVGYESHSYYPNNLTANPGDVIVFQFIAEGHTVVQSNFQEPCVPRDAYHPGRSVFFSGWYNTSAVHSNNVSDL
jgi:plastocyanin